MACTTSAIPKLSGSSPHDLAPVPPLRERANQCSSNILTTAPCTGGRASADNPRHHCQQHRRGYGKNCGRLYGCPRALPSALVPVNSQPVIFNIATALPPMTDANLVPGDNIAGSPLGINTDSPNLTRPGFLNALTSPSNPYNTSDIAPPSPVFQPFQYQLQQYWHYRNQNPSIYLSGPKCPK